MNIIKFLLITVTAFSMISGVNAETKGDKKMKKTEILPYKDPSKPIDIRVKDLMSRMTLEEKVAQTWSIWKESSELLDEKGVFKTELVEDYVKNGIGHWARLTQGLDTKKRAEFANQVQKYVIEHNRLGIPVIIHDEGLHGFMSKGATHFPQAIGMASSWDPELVQQIYSVVAKEMRVSGNHQALTPDLDLAREPRWGRTEETYGEDPYLVSRMGVAAVKGFQGENRQLGSENVIATIKHFAVHGQPERGINFSPGNFSERIIRTEFLYPFECAVKEAGAFSLMASYNEIDGIPSHSNKWLLGNVLRGEWDFDGYIVGDYNGITHLYTFQYVANDKYEAARMALEAGVDVELPDNQCYSTLAEQIKDGRVSEDLLDKAVARTLRIKFLLGLFDDPYVDPDYAVKVTNCDEHKKLALKAAKESMVLLKNDNNTLPLDMNKIKSIAVIGPNAADIHLGGYSWETPREGISILDGIKQKVGKKVEIKYAEGCRITEGTPLWKKYEVIAANPLKNAELIKEAVQVAKTCDVVILAIGGNEATCREAWAKDHLGDRNSLDLLGQQNDLVKAIVELGKTTVAILINGRPLTINYVAENIPAIIEGWYLGQETGTAVAGAIFGEFSPGGKLPVTFPRSVGDLPVYYYSKPAVVQDYLFDERKPLYPFGFGLSYTKFSIEKVAVSPQIIKPSGKTEVHCYVTNNGTMEGDEVVQLYIRDEVSSVTRPMKELKDFKRITLKPGETKPVIFELGPEKLSFINRNMEKVVEPGDFDIMVGANSMNLTTVKLKVVEK